MGILLCNIPAEHHVSVGEQFPIKEDAPPTDPPGNKEDSSEMWVCENNTVCSSVRTSHNGRSSIQTSIRRTRHWAVTAVHPPLEEQGFANRATFPSGSPLDTIPLRNESTIPPGRHNETPALTIAMALFNESIPPAHGMELRTRR